jgi:hypothetical protein
MEEIQKSVDQRMGPHMCDNSEYEGRQLRRNFEEILKGYKKEIASKCR